MRGDHIVPPGSEGRIIRLSEVPIGGCGRIVRVEGEPALKQRLMEMGFVGGTYIWPERVAPLGDPVSYFIRGYYVSLRRHEAENVWVELCSAGQGPGRGGGRGRNRFRFKGGFLP